MSLVGGRVWASSEEPDCVSGRAWACRACLARPSMATAAQWGCGGIKALRGMHPCSRHGLVMRSVVARRREGGGSLSCMCLPRQQGGAAGTDRTTGRPWASGRGMAVCSRASPRCLRVSARARVCVCVCAMYAFRRVSRAAIPVRRSGYMNMMTDAGLATATCTITIPPH